MTDSVKSTNVIEHVETEKNSDGACLSFRKIEIVYNSGRVDTGFTFVWLDCDGHITPVRGQVLIPDEKTVAQLLLKAMAAGWFAN